MAHLQKQFLHPSNISALEKIKHPIRHLSEPSHLVNRGVALSKRETENRELRQISLCALLSQTKLLLFEQVLFVLSKEVSKHKCQFPN